MIPSLLQAYSDINVPAPPGFSPAESVEWARLDSNIYQMPTKGKTYSQKLGIRYENQVQHYLSERYGQEYKNNPWFSFKDSSGSRRCRPDGLLLCAAEDGSALAIIYEIKIRHMPDAWWQLRKLYSPVVAAAFPRHEIRVVEIVKEFDPAMPFPEAVERLEKLDDIWLRKEFSALGVFLWKR